MGYIVHGVTKSWTNWASDTFTFTWTARKLNQLILQEINPEYSLEVKWMSLSRVRDWQIDGNNLYTNYPEADLDLRIYEQVIYKKMLLREPWKQ